VRLQQVELWVQIATREGQERIIPRPSPHGHVSYSDGDDILEAELILSRPESLHSMRKINRSDGIMKGRLHTAETNGVDAYIAKCPTNIQAKLEEIRSAIREAAPGAAETMSYFEMPGYSYPGYDYNGMFAWFGLKKSHIGLYLRPPTIQNHEKELASYDTTKAVVHFPLDENISVPLVKKLVKSSLRVMRDKSRSGKHSRPPT
jgi:uncharacterized protein YdhG (YjbR/CyaY superfamily)